MGKYNDDFGDRMKSYEAVETARRFDRTLPVYARIDGRTFSSFTKGMDKPYYFPMIWAMQETCAYLVEKTNPRIGFVQSDEISLVFEADLRVPDSSIFFGGRIQKMCSVLASMAAAKFAQVCPEGYEDKLPHFDCRVLQLPSRTEAANAILWRAMDARKNAVFSLARTFFSHNEVHGKTQKQMLEMLEEKDIYFDEYPYYFTEGSYYKRERYLTSTEYSEEPVWRHRVARIDMPFFRDVINRKEVIFLNEEPKLREYETI